MRYSLIALASFSWAINQKVQCCQGKHQLWFIAIKTTLHRKCYIIMFFFCKNITMILNLKCMGKGKTYICQWIGTWYSDNHIIRWCDVFIRGGIWLHSQLPSTRVHGDYQLIIAINSSILVNNRTRSAAECHP